MDFEEVLSLMSDEDQQVLREIALKIRLVDLKKLKPTEFKITKVVITCHTCKNKEEHFVKMGRMLGSLWQKIEAIPAQDVWDDISYLDVPSCFLCFKAVNLAKQYKAEQYL